MRLGIVGIVLTILVVDGAEVILHGYAGTAGTPLASRMASAYLQRDPDNHKAYLAGVVDLLIPAIILGVALGTFGAAWRPRRLALAVAILSLGVIVLLPAYASFFPSGSARWWSPSDAAPLKLSDYLVAYIKALALCGVTTYGATLLSRHFQH